MINTKPLFFLLLLALACNKKTPQTAKEISIEKVPTAISQNSNAVIKADSISTNLPVMKFDDVNFSFGEIKQGEIVTHDFSFINNGKIPLIISNATASCGCTVPEYPKKPILPGEIGMIKVKFNSAGFEGEKNKQITLDTNTANKQEVINFKAIVNK
ncbi:MAG: DUF1573 domain-containing protein [Solirubrobacteraceae bacterium]